MNEYMYDVEMNHCKSEWMQEQVTVRMDVWMNEWMTIRMNVWWMNEWL